MTNSISMEIDTIKIIWLCRCGLYSWFDRLLFLNPPLCICKNPLISRTNAQNKNFWRIIEHKFCFIFSIFSVCYSFSTGCTKNFLQFWKIGPKRLASYKFIGNTWFLSNVSFGYTKAEKWKKDFKKKIASFFCGGQNDFFNFWIDMPLWKWLYTCKNIQFSSTTDPPAKETPSCTLRHFPYLISHTIQWAREKFGDCFTFPSEVANEFLNGTDSFFDRIGSMNVNEQVCFLSEPFYNRGGIACKTFRAKFYN